MVLGEVDTHDLPTVLADESQMEILFQNSVSNGLKFRSAAAPRVCIDAEMYGEGDFLFRVTDNDVGIPAEEREKVFRMFHRLDNRNEYLGTGLGLALCRRIVERHGGRIWVGPSASGESVFSVLLPARPPQSGKSE